MTTALAPTPSHMIGQLLESPEEGSIPLPCRAESCAGSCRWLISLDYDGTLRQEGEHSVQADFFELMHQWRPLGIRWGINTGRSLHKLSGELAHFPCMPDFICTCERYAYLADEHGLLHPATTHNARCYKANMELRAILSTAWQKELESLRRRLPHCQWQLAVDDPLSIEAEDSATMDRLMPYLLPFAGESVAIQRAGRFMRLSDARYTKGSALRCVQQAWQVQESHLFLMGDGHNDIDAFRHFPLAWCAAPATAHQDVIDWLQTHGGYISPKVGVMDALRRWQQQQGGFAPC